MYGIFVYLARNTLKLT